MNKVKWHSVIMMLRRKITNKPVKSIDLINFVNSRTDLSRNDIRTALEYLIDNKEIKKKYSTDGEEYIKY